MTINLGSAIIPQDKSPLAFHPFCFTGCQKVLYRTTGRISIDTRSFESSRNMLLNKTIIQLIADNYDISSQNGKNGIIIIIQERPQYKKNMLYMLRTYLGLGYKYFYNNGSESLNNTIRNWMDELTDSIGENISHLDIGLLSFWKWSSFVYFCGFWMSLSTVRCLHHANNYFGREWCVPST